MLLGLKIVSQIIDMDIFPWGVSIILGSGLTFTAYVIYYILKLAHSEMKNEKSGSDPINQESKH